MKKNPKCDYETLKKFSKIMCIMHKNSKYV